MTSSRLTQQISPRLRLGLGAIVAMLIIQYGLLPLLDWQQQRAKRVISLQETISRKKGLIGQEENITTLYEQYQTLRDGLAGRFEADIKDPQTLQLKLQKLIESLSVTLGVKIQNVDWMPVTKTGVVRGPVKFRLETTPELFINLINAIETKSEFLTIDTIRINARPQSLTITVELEISAYGLYARKSAS